MKHAEAVILSDFDCGTTIAAGLAQEDCRVDCYGRLEDLLSEHTPDSIPVLIFHCRERPKGSLLGVIGRLAVEYPGMQKAVLTDAALSVDVAGFLTSCDVDLVRTAPERPITGQLATVVSRMHERRNRSLAVC